ncbi:hypothetical protein [Vibrio coralliirubri]|uniref:hypothetical protein n=1 Tax=Vibrio coralliirubri TaxID=1516159 RepID=UPI000A360475|nr:hypothetical protein [Vibrio coralliirubri]
MKRLTAAALIISTAFGASCAHAINNSSQYNLDVYERFQSLRDGEAYNIYAGAEDTRRMLVMEAKWYPFPELSTGICEDTAKRVGHEYAASKGVAVALSDATSIYLDGTYGYSFKVTPIVVKPKGFKLQA